MEQSKNTSANQQGSTTVAAPMKNIVDTAIAAGNFTTLVAGIKAAGLTDTLKGRGPFTVFAPTDEAFRKLPSGALDALLKDTAKLKSILNYHVITGHVLVQDLKSGDVMTVQGNSVISPHRMASSTPSTQSLCQRTGNCSQPPPKERRVIGT
jgi:uncharacterized surface protein with fasciclin (FAS1) repeats